MVAWGGAEGERPPSPPLPALLSLPRAGGWGEGRRAAAAACAAWGAGAEAGEPAALLRGLLPAARRAALASQAAGLCNA